MTNILAFDTSSAHCGAAVMRGGQIVASTQETMRKGQSERLMPLLEDLMASQGMVWEELDAIAVGTGPGNFTGVRIAVSVARGLRLGLGIPAIGVSSFAALQAMCDATGKRPMVLSLPSSRQDYAMIQYRQNDEDIGPPFEAHLYDGSLVHAAPIPDGADFYGEGGEVIAAYLAEARGQPGAMIGEPGATEWAHTIAEVAHQRLATKSTFERPKPIYIRPADAAPSKTPAPVILT